MNDRPALSRLYYVALLAIVVLAAFLRVYNLKDLPPGFFCDEAGNGYNAYSIEKTGRDLRNSGRGREPKRSPSSSAAPHRRRLSTPALPVSAT